MPKTPKAIAVNGDLIPAPATLSPASEFSTRLMAHVDPRSADPVSQVCDSIRVASAMEEALREMLIKDHDTLGTDAFVDTSSASKGQQPTALALLHGEWSDRRFSYSEKALRLGIDKKRVEDQQAVGALFAKAIMRALFDPSWVLSAEQRTQGHAVMMAALGSLGS